MAKKIAKKKNDCIENDPFLQLLKPMLMEKGTWDEFIKRELENKTNKRRKRGF
ncbi:MULTISPECIES: hypothetical protein [Clostridium]|uniref:hypothetical protein n=1 Tax=Clostridium TaxID=1485 RepID=UPI002904B4E5|nr:hypothetical protein [Clostridium sp.]MDU1312162.1 hypothetical protein [Clostridium sp.]MDU1409555.1 hypothetical protein [Clostridium sp.]